MDATVHRLPSFSAPCCAAFCATAFGGITNNTVDRSSRNIGSGMDNGAVTTTAYDGANSPRK